jgi:hypothetical protein
MCPTPGVVVESKDVSAQRVEHANKVWHQLYQAKVSLLNARRELKFWNASLTNVFSEMNWSIT